MGYRILTVILANLVEGKIDTDPRNSIYVNFRTSTVAIQGQVKESERISHFEE